MDYLVDPQIIRIERNRTVVVDARQQLTSCRSTRQRRAATRESFARKSFQFEELCTLPQRGGQRERERGCKSSGGWTPLDRKFVDCGEAPRGIAPRRRSFPSLISYGASFRDENCKGWTGNGQITQVVVTYKGLRPPCCRPEREKAWGGRQVSPSRRRRNRSFSP